MRFISKTSFLAVVLSLSFFFSHAASANNLQITNVSLEDRDQSNDVAVVEFDIDWDNSWRDSDNWDAVWVFLKVSKNSGNWVHGMMAASGYDPWATDGGSGTSLTVQVPPHKAGALIYRSGTGSGTTSANDVNLVLDYGASPVSAGDDDVIEVRVYGIEMTFIPEGNFSVGSNEDEGSTNLTGYFWDACHSSNRYDVDVTSTRPYLSDEDDGTGTCGDIAWEDEWGAGSDPYNRTQIPTDWPYGYEEFYLMKYELTQGQYRDFLNTLPSSHYSNRVQATTNNYYAMYNSSSISHRNTIKYKSSGGPFVCDLDGDNTGDESNDGEWIAMNYMTWPDCAAFSDWAGMRPATELEYRKACQGTGGGSYWGTESYPHDSQVENHAEIPISNAGTSSEAPNNVTDEDLMNYEGYSGSEIDGPLRVGFAATSSADRDKAAAGACGNMELSGNVSEYYAGVSRWGSSADDFAGSHGDGVLSTTSSYEGNATNSDWPGWDTNNPARGVTKAKYTQVNKRGGSFADGGSVLYVQDRYRSNSTSDRGETDYHKSGCRLAVMPGE